MVEQSADHGLVFPRWMFGTGVSLVLCRAVTEVLPGIESVHALPFGGIGLLLDGASVVMLLLGFWVQLSAEGWAVRAERARIAGDLHDGLGFHLTTALSLAGDTRDTNSEAWLTVELAIVELHSVIHFMHSDGQSVVQAMGSLRYRIQKVVDQRGLTLVWDVRHDVPDNVLQGAAAYHFIKIVQEALSNVLQHSRAQRLIVELRCPFPHGMLLLRIADDGVGIGERNSHARHRGLDGMFRRSELLGGTLSIDPVPEGGTCVRLSVPLSPPETKP